MKTSVKIRFTSGREERFEMEFWGGPGPKHACGVSGETDSAPANQR